VKIKTIIEALENWAPPAYQESYDNARLITGNKNWDCTGVLTTLDCIESVVEEAIEKKCNLIVAHHPIVFSGLKSITGKNYIERTIIKAIKNDVAIYAIHTNLDSISLGVNKVITDKLQLKNAKILAPKTQVLNKLTTFCPTKDAENIRETIFNAGAGKVGHYENCSFNIEGTGTFKGDESTNPHVGEKDKLHTEEETRIEVIFPSYLKRNILQKLKEAHPYEEVAYYINSLENENQEVGSGMIGELEEAMEINAFLRQVKHTFNCKTIRYTQPIQSNIKRVAVCGGSGSFLLNAAIAQKADIFITADYKYHQFFDADNQIVIADIGHYESEQFTSVLLHDFLTQKFSNFAVLISEQNTNPINYL